MSIQNIKNKFFKNIVNNEMTLVWTKIRRDNTKILNNQKKKFQSNKLNLDKIKSYAETFYNILKEKKISKNVLGDLLNKSQSLKIKLANNIVNSQIDK